MRTKRQVGIRQVGIRSKPSIGADLAKGAVAGAVATAVMTAVNSTLREQESPSVRRREVRARRGKTAAAAAAEKGAKLVGTSLSAAERRQAGQALHWALGIGAGATYAVLRHRVGRLGPGAGLAFGSGFWLLLDKVVVPALGITPGPTALPWQTQARGLAGRLSFGAVTDATLNVLDRVV